MAWVLLLTASLFEVFWAVSLRSTEGFTRFWPSVQTIAGLVVSIVLLAFAVRTIPIGTGYAVWTGLGAAGTAAVGMLVLHEPADPRRMACLVLILAGVLGLKILH